MIIIKHYINWNYYHYYYFITYLAEDLLIRREGEIEDVGDVVILDPEQAAVEFAVQRLQVTQVAQLSQQGLVERPREEGVEEEVVDDGQADHSSTEPEPEQKTNHISYIGINIILE